MYAKRTRIKQTINDIQSIDDLDEIKGQIEELQDQQNKEVSAIKDQIPSILLDRLSVHLDSLNIMFGNIFNIYKRRRKSILKEQKDTLERKATSENSAKELIKKLR